MTYLLLILFFILISGIMAGCETALLAAPRSVIKELVERGSKSAKIIQKFQKDPENLIATANVGFIISLSLASFLGGLYALNSIAPYFKASTIPMISEYSSFISVAIVIPILAFIAIVVGELVPKSLVLKLPVPVAMTIAYPFSWLSIIFRPIIFLLRGISNAILKPFKDQTSFSEARVSEEEFKILLEEGTKSGTIDKTEQELITSIFEFTDTTAKEVMIPRTDVVAVSIDTPREKLVNIVLEEGYSRLPVYSGSIDNIIGIIYTKDLISLLEHRDIILLQDIIRPAYFVPEAKKISKLMRELQQQKIHIAIVVDEFGGTEGIITMEDILEEIVGEIHDEYDEELKEIETSADGTVLVNARINIKDFNEKFNANIPEDDEYETIS
ncbi:MAG: hemolysin family protein, partial [Bacteroidetes bacterium]|nr:hemolysin family protein [Bacteroidota bacterium]MBU1423004.1 hemolysin family protein [Bacteroidota bacterium]